LLTQEENLAGLAAINRERIAMTENIGSCDEEQFGSLGPVSGV
jgi:hypothetical protein